MAVVTTQVLMMGCGEPEARGRCEQVATGETRVCIDEGWFMLPRWSSIAQRKLPDGMVEHAPATPTLLDAFVIDVREVTNAEFAEFVQATGAPPIPDICGWTESSDPDEIPVTEVSGWTAGAPPVDKLDHPVVCVSRSDVLAYCSWRGGRPVSVFEFLRAGRAPMPDQRPHPWGESPPGGEANPGLEGLELPADWHLDYAVVNAWSSTEVSTRPAGSEPLGGSSEGVRGLVGNASELLADCQDDLFQVLDLHGRDETDPAIVEFIRPRTPLRAICIDHKQVVGGSNWRSAYHRDSFGVSAFGWNRVDFYGLDTYVFAPLVMGGFRREIDPSSNNEPRSWRVGFRCAYDVE